MDVTKRVFDLLRPLGITEKYIGAVQLSMAVQILMADSSHINAVLKEIYGVIAGQYAVDWKAVERNIRTVAKLAWNSNPRYLEEIAGYPLTDRPTATQLIEIVLHNVQQD